MSKKFDLYQNVTDKIVGMLEQGVAPWRNPIIARSGGWSTNLVSKKPYRGVNVFLLAITEMFQGYDSSYWLTFKQCTERGGKIKKGEKSTMIVFWSTIDKLDPKTEEKKKIWFLRYYNVFNVCQCEGIEAPDQKPVVLNSFEAIERAQQIADGYVGPSIKEGGSRAVYRKAIDEIGMPKKEHFTSSAEYYATLFHEQSHSTGHVSRLNRASLNDAKQFGDEEYSKEELIAEMGAAFLCAEAGISPLVVENSAAYLDNWIKRLKGDSKLIVQAAGAAQKAADMILGRVAGQVEVEESSEEIEQAMAV